MKNIATAIFCIISISIYAQELDHVNELFFQAEEVDNGFDIAFIVQPVNDEVQYTRSPLPQNKWKIVSDANTQYIQFEGNYIGYDYALDAIFSDDPPYGNTFWITLNRVS